MERCESIEEDYIDMEVTSFKNLVHKTLNNKPREFEFQMNHLCPFERDTTTSPADELFYKGKLLPLHLPPRLQMVQKLLQDYTFEEFYSTPLSTTPITSNTPFESCTVSPVESCQVSQELNPTVYFSQCSGGLYVEEENSKRSWSKKLRLVKQLSLGSKIKASRAYLRSFFGKSGCSDESCASAARVADEGSVLRYSKVGFGQVKTEKLTKKQSNVVNGSHRRSFSVSMRRQPAKKSFQSSSCEIENSIQGAILHCKQSLEQKQKQKYCGDLQVGLCSLSVSRTDDQERAQLFRG